MRHRRHNLQVVRFCPNVHRRACRHRTTPLFRTAQVGKARLPHTPTFSFGKGSPPTHHHLPTPCSEALSEGASMRFRLLLWLLLNVGAVGFFTSLQYLTAFIGTQSVSQPVLHSREYSAPSYSITNCAAASVGINSMLISILLPIIFYYQLRREELSKLRRAMFHVLIAFALVVTLVISYVDIGEFIKYLS